jgi:hypothetical protein
MDHFSLEDLSQDWLRCQEVISSYDFDAPRPAWKTWQAYTDTLATVRDGIRATKYSWSDFQRAL